MVFSLETVYHSVFLMMSECLSEDELSCSPVMFSGIMKKVAVDAILWKRQELKQLSDSIWDEPELCFKEEHAHQVLTKFLKSNGFRVSYHHFLPTAFRAEYSLPTSSPGVTVCIICEYDALPEIGHGCGHNLIAEAGVAAAIGVKRAIDAYRNIRGKLVVMGTPGGEGGGGKIRLIQNRAFKDIDFALMVHPDTTDSVFLRSQASSRARVIYHGRGTHAASPWNGINALDAAIACYNNLASLRQQMRPLCNISSIITKGGIKINVIPDRTELLVGLEGPSRKDVGRLKETSVQCFEAAALGTRCRVEYRFIRESTYNSLVLNEPLLNIYRTAAESYGVKFHANDLPEQLRSGGATDMGNLSRLIPCIHPRFAIPTNGPIHTKEFAVAAGSTQAQAPTIRAASCLTITILKLMTNPLLQNKARVAFAEEKRKHA